jgi:hypothetical protein
LAISGAIIVTVIAKKKNTRLQSVISLQKTLRRQFQPAGTNQRFGRRIYVPISP